MASNLLPKYSVRPEEVDVNLRISSAGAIVAPALGAVAAAAKSSTGVYTITFASPHLFAEFLGAQVTVEGTGTAVSAVPKHSWNSATRVLTVTLLDAKAASAAVDSAFSVSVWFSDSVVP